MKRLLFALALFCVPCFATNAVFITQTASGGNTGVDCANAKAVTYFNTSGNWSGSPSGILIGPDTTVHICSTFNPGSVNTNMLTFHGSGTSGHPITLKFETSALVTSGGFGNSANGAIVVGGNTNIVIDGGTTCGWVNKAEVTCNGTIQNTANGSSLTNQIDSNFIYALNCTNCVFKNLLLSGIYVHTKNTDGTHAIGAGIEYSGSNVTIQNVWCDGAFVCVDSPYVNGTVNNVIANSIFDHMNWGVHIGNSAPTTLDSTLIHDNEVKNMDNWDVLNTDPCSSGGPGFCYHHDGFFVVQNDTGAAITNTAIYNNVFNGDQGLQATAWIFTNTGINGFYVFNNVMRGSEIAFQIETGFGGNSPVDQNIFIYNNYMDCGAGGGGVSAASVTGWTFKNNAMSGCGVYLNSTSILSPSIDHNDYAAIPGGTNTFKWLSGGGQNFAGYRGSFPALDPNTITPASLGANTTTGVPNAGSSMIHDGTTNFVNLTASCTGVVAPLCTDPNGNARPSTGTNNWDAGAFQFASSAPPPGFAPQIFMGALFSVFMVGFIGIPLHLLSNRFLKGSPMKVFVVLAVIFVATSSLAQQAQSHQAALNVGSQPSYVSGINYFQSTTKGGPYVKVAACVGLPPTATCNISGLAANTTYYFVATALCPSCAPNPTESGYSAEVSGTTKPDSPVVQPPTLFPPQQISSNPPVVKETWDLAAAPSVYQQFVYRQGPVSAAWNQQKVLRPGINSYVDLTARKGKTYAYEVVEADRQGHMLAASAPSPKITVQ